MVDRISAIKTDKISISGLRAEISPYWNVNGNPCCSVAVETPCRNLTILECKCEKIVGSVVTIGAGILPYWNGNFVNESKYSSGS